ncbi:hypothetical protein [Paraflavitalea sp. CAU 1676]|uniref:hypothetical protein n=1 Tax=Paraflavitalea sp. CAU 1676 TaxID=3032598 RepID=UPI0023DB2424|nr:hypothetical protein [Paraflavitalea sp. CAU 1676]MDF2189710.1 hypothetical protein [Paraflavitalea sp. CAU 1676]
MLSAKEKRFIKSWEEQRTGGRASYFALYIPVLTIVSAIITAFLFSMFAIVSSNLLISIAVISLVAGISLSILSWFRNEKKWKTIIRREIKQGQQQDHGAADASKN